MSFFYFLRKCKDKHGECIFLAVSVSTRKDRTTRKPLRGAHLEARGVGVANQLPFFFAIDKISILCYNKDTKEQEENNNAYTEIQ